MKAVTVTNQAAGTAGMTLAGRPRAAAVASALLLPTTAAPAPLTDASYRDMKARLPSR